MAATGRRFRVKKKTKKISTTWQLVYGIIALIVVAGLAYGVWYVTRLPMFTIASVEVSGGETITHEVIHERVEEALEGSYAFVIPKRFVYFYPHEEIAEAVRQVPRIKDVAVTAENRTTLSVTFDEYIPHALWCESLEAHVCTFITDEGYSFAGAAPSLATSSPIAFQKVAPPRFPQQIFGASMHSLRVLSRSCISVRTLL